MKRSRALAETGRRDLVTDLQILSIGPGETRFESASEPMALEPMDVTLLELLEIRLADRVIPVPYYVPSM